MLAIRGYPVPTCDHARKAKIDLLDVDEFNLRATVTQTHPWLLNQWRRVILADIPTLAFDIVEIAANTSMLSDECLAHRLAFLPLKPTNPDRLVCACNNLTVDEQGTGLQGTMLREREDGQIGLIPEVCTICQVIFNLDVANTTTGKLLVTNRHLTTNCTDVLIYGDDSKEDIPLVYLYPGQSIHLKAISKKGYGRLHAKWSAVSIVVINTQADIEFNKRDDIKAITIPEGQEYRQCYNLHIETLGKISPSDVFISSLKILLDKLNLSWDEFMVL